MLTNFTFWEVNSFAFGGELDETTLMPSIIIRPISLAQTVQTGGNS